jgi:hypothetical protein
MDMDTTDENITLIKLMEEYLETLSEKEKKSYDIAKEHLGSSFQLEKSVGFLKWVKSKKG